MWIWSTFKTLEYPSRSIKADEKNKFRNCLWIAGLRAGNHPEPSEPPQHVQEEALSLLSRRDSLEWTGPFYPWCDMMTSSQLMASTPIPPILYVEQQVERTPTWRNKFSQLSTKLKENWVLGDYLSVYSHPTYLSKLWKVSCDFHCHHSWRSLHFIINTDTYYQNKFCWHNIKIIAKSQL